MHLQGIELLEVPHLSVEEVEKTIPFKGGAFVWLALDADGAAHQVDELFGDGQSKSSAAKLS